MSRQAETFDASVAGAEKAERSDAVVERDDDNVAEHGQSLAIVHPQRAVDTALPSYTHKEL